MKNLILVVQLTAVLARLAASVVRVIDIISRMGWV